MAPPVFAPPPGITYPVQKTVLTSSISSPSVSGKENPIPLWPFPRYRWTLAFNYLYSDIVNAQLQYLQGFYGKMQGRAGLWQWSDPDDNAQNDAGTAQVIGTGDGVTTQFGLIRSFGGNIEPVYAPFIDSTHPVVNLNGVPFSNANWRFGTTGMLLFNSPPANGVVISWVGTFNWLVRFDDDTLDFSAFVKQIYEAQKVSFTSTLQTWA